MKRTIFVILTLVIGACSCWAPIHDKPAGKDYHGELSESQLNKLQGSGIMGETPDSVTVPDSSPATTDTSSKNPELASKILSGVNTSSQAAQQSLAQGTKDAKHPQAGEKQGFTLMMGGLFVLAGLGVAYGVRTYMDKVVPEPNKRRIK